MTVDRNGMSHTAKGRPDGGRYESRNDGHGGDSDITDPTLPLDEDNKARLDATWPDRMTALRNAGLLEPYEGAISLSRRGDGYGLTAHGFDGNGGCEIEYDPAGALSGGISFPDGAPEAYRIATVMEPPAWMDLQPVKDWREGRIDSVRIWTIQPAGVITDPDDPDDMFYTDASDHVVYCAERDTPPQWEDRLDREPELRDALANATMNRRDVTVWPGNTGDPVVYVGDRQGRELMRVGIVGPDSPLPVPWIETTGPDGERHLDYPDTGEPGLEELIDLRLDTALNRRRGI
ncbi:hypothetical protein [Bifidobacterium sp. SO1]|uniref:hypothetical protein n=1 Tax=Bifidobacterium sp. SO1 TaxID=2809029 RepID=UPI001BDBD7FD|nr:hypothetical protein [Bifidobacterium sp. SO1]MBT1162744.1 hypothetical protein [Bifidobacterium sp. SO1]